MVLAISEKVPTRLKKMLIINEKTLHGSTMTNNHIGNEPARP